MGQFVEYDGIDKKLSKIIGISETSKASLTGIDSLIQESVGENGVAWSGDSASAFRTSWDELSAEIPKFIQTIENQVFNIQQMLELTKQSDNN